MINPSEALILIVTGTSFQLVSASLLIAGARAHGTDSQKSFAWSLASIYFAILSASIWITGAIVLTRS